MRKTPTLFHQGSKFTQLGQALFQKLKLVSTFYMLVSWSYATKTTNYSVIGVNLFTHTLQLQTKACFVATFVFAVEVHVTRARSLPKIKARFHILMLVSCLCDQNDQLSFLGVEVHVTRASSLPKIISSFPRSCLFRGYATKTTNFGSWGRSSRVATLYTFDLCNDMVREVKDVRRNQHQIVGHQIVNRI